MDSMLDLSMLPTQPFLLLLVPLCVVAFVMCVVTVFKHMRDKCDEQRRRRVLKQTEALVAPVPAQGAVIQTNDNHTRLPKLVHRHNDSVLHEFSIDEESDVDLFGEADDGIYLD